MFVYKTPFVDVICAVILI